VATDATPAEPSATSAATASLGVAGGVAARLDRLPVQPYHWRFVFLAQLFWAACLMIDPLTERLYPAVWLPHHAFSSLDYSLLVGFSNGLGPLIGEYTFGFIGDRFGRKISMIASCAIAGLIVIPEGITTNWPVLMLIVTLAGVGVGGALVTAPVYMTEVSPPHARSTLMLGGQVVGFGFVILVASVPALYLLPAYPAAFVLLFAAFPLLLIPVFLAALPESPRWLEGKGRLDQADAIVTKLENIARRRGHTLPEPDFARYSVPERERVPVGEVFKGQYLQRTVVLLGVWLLLYAGIDYGFNAYSGVYVIDAGWSAHDLFVMILIGGAFGITGLAVNAFIGERVERKTSVAAAGVLMCVGAALFYFFPHSFAWLTTATAVTSIAAGVFITNLYNYTASAYPTRVRSVGTGWTDGVGHGGAVAGPLIAGALFAVTASDHHIAWFLWFTIAGSLLPGFLLLGFGMKQKSAVLEVISH
jgi:MFS family permease